MVKLFSARLNLLLLTAVVGFFSASLAGAASYRWSTGTLEFSSAKLSVAQNAGKLTVSVARVNGSRGKASLRYWATPVTAKSGDYTPPTGVLSWASGDSSVKNFSVSISNAKPFAGTKLFKVNLSNATGADLGTPSTATVTITGSQGAVASTVALSATGYTVAAGSSVKITANRSGSSAGAAAVNYATSNGTAVAGTNYMSSSGTFSWAAGDMTAKTVAIPLTGTTAFAGTKTFMVNLTAPSNATLGSPSSAVATITGAGSGTTASSIALSSASYAVNQAAGTVTITANRTGDTSAAVTAAYATSNGTASAGTDYTAKSGTLSWAASDTAAKTFTVAVSNAVPFTGSRTFTVTLSGATGGATLAAPTAATASITGSAVAVAGDCTKAANAWTTTGAYDSKQYGNYFVNNNNWGGTAGQKLWANSADCWGVTTTQTKDISSISSYPSVTRGWSQNATAMQQASTSGTNDWTTKSGMGIAVTALTKAKIHWAFTAPTAGVRWLGLQDIYYHKTNKPDPTEFPPFVDLMIDQAIADQVIGSTTFYAAEAAAGHGTKVTIGGNQYLVFIDDPDEAGYHQSGGHNIHLFNLPTAFTSNSALAIWGSFDAVNDLAAITQYFMKSNPVDDAGKPLVNYSGQAITSPLIASSLYLNAINSGWEIDTGTVFTNTAFCVSLQNEVDCP